MIVSKLYGGLGNQLFQYAIARRIAYLKDVPLRLDISYFKANNLRKYKLDNFNIKAEIATSQDLAFFIETGSRSFLTRLVNKCKPYYKKYFIREKSLEFDPNLLKASGHVYLDGYWQSEKYFFDIQNLLRQELTVRHEPDTMDMELLRKIRRVNSVCIHIRRGDYISDPSTNQIHGVCNLDYYHRAVALLMKSVATPHFFIFSDDHEWSQVNMRLESPMTFVTHNDTDKEYEDLRLMAACDHYIIANSSFSWWGAWLGKHPEKTVIAPKKWGNDPALNTINRLPESWLTI